MFYFKSFLHTPSFSKKNDAGDRALNFNKKFQIWLKPYVYFVKPKKEELLKFEYKKAMFLSTTLKNDVIVNINDTDRNGLVISNFYIEEPDVYEKKLRNKEILNRRRYGFIPFRGKYVTDKLSNLYFNKYLLKYRYTWLNKLSLVGTYDNLEPSLLGFAPILSSRPEQLNFLSKEYYGNFHSFKLKFFPNMFVDSSTSNLLSHMAYRMNHPVSAFRFVRLRKYKLLRLEATLYRWLSSKNYYTLTSLPQYSAYYSNFLRKANRFFRFRRRPGYQKWIGTLLPNRFFLFKKKRSFFKLPFFFKSQRYFRNCFFLVRLNLNRFLSKHINSDLNVTIRNFFLNSFKYICSNSLINYMHNYIAKFNFMTSFFNFNLLHHQNNCFVPSQYFYKLNFKLYKIYPIIKKLTLTRYKILYKTKFITLSQNLPYFLLKTRYLTIRFRLFKKLFFKILRILLILVNFSFRISKIGFNHKKYWKLFQHIFNPLVFRFQLMRLLHQFFNGLLKNWPTYDFRLTNFSTYIYFYINKFNRQFKLLENFNMYFFPRFLKTYYYGFKNSTSLLRYRFAHSTLQKMVDSRLWYKRLYQHYLFNTELEEDFYTIFMAQFFYASPIPILFKNASIRLVRRTRTDLISFNFFTSSSYNSNILISRGVENRFLYLHMFARDVVVDYLHADESLTKDNVVSLSRFAFSSNLASTTLITNG
jgi:hypothetical protein